MKDPLGVNPSKGSQGTTRGKIPVEKTILASVGIEPTTSRLDLPLPFDSHRGQKHFLFTSCGSLIPFTSVNTRWVFHGLHIAL